MLDFLQVLGFALSKAGKHGPHVVWQWWQSLPSTMQLQSFMNMSLCVFVGKLLFYIHCCSIWLSYPYLLVSLLILLLNLESCVCVCSSRVICEFELGSRHLVTSLLPSNSSILIQSKFWGLKLPSHFPLLDVAGWIPPFVGRGKPPMFDESADLRRSNSIFQGFPLHDDH